MKKSVRKNLYIFIILNLSLLIFAISYTLIFVFKKDLIMPGKCRFQSVFGFYCPGCGGSRSLKALLSFDFIKSFVLYPPIILSALAVLHYDIRLLFSVIKKNTKYTDKFKFYTFLIIPISIILTFLIRNVLLLCFGIDTVGDFIH